MLDRTNHNELANKMNERIGIGGNNPPGPLQSAKDAMTELGAFLKETPVITSPEEAKQGGTWLERTRISLGALEDERKEKVTPLNEELSTINGLYRAVREPLEKALKTLRQRMTDYATAVEAARIAEAERLRKEAEAKEAAARAAEQAEQDAIACADVGECSDVGAAIQQADDSFRDYRKADKAAAIAERGVPVRVGSTMGGRAMSMRTTEVLKVSDAHAAIKAMGITPEIELAIVASARKFRKAHDELPAGVVAEFQRSM